MLPRPDGRSSRFQATTTTRLPCRSWIGLPKGEPLFGVDGDEVLTAGEGQGVGGAGGHKIGGGISAIDFHAGGLAIDEREGAGGGIVGELDRSFPEVRGMQVAVEVENAERWSDGRRVENVRAGRQPYDRAVGDRPRHAIDFSGTAPDHADALG